MASVTINETALASDLTETASSLVVISATGIAAGNVLVVGREACRVQASYDSGTTIPVTRGLFGTRAVPHETGESILCGEAKEFNQSDPQGQADTTLVYALPWVNLRSGRRWQIAGTTWYEIPLQDRTGIQSVTPDDSDGWGVNMIRPDARVVMVGANVNGVNDWITLPVLSSVPDGHEVKVFCNAAGMEIRTPASSAEEINSEDCDGTKEYTVPSGSEVHIFYKLSDALGWMGAGWTAIGAKTTAVVPGA